MLTHFVIVLRHLRTPRERPLAFRPIACCHLRQSRLTATLCNSCPDGQTLACCPLRTPPERPLAFRRLCLLSFRRGSQAKPAAQSAGKTLREEKAVTRKECAKAHTGFAPQCRHCYHAGAGNDSLKRCFFRPFESL